MNQVLKYKNFIGLAGIVVVFFFFGRIIHSNYQREVRRLEYKKAELDKKKDLLMVLERIDKEIRSIEGVPLKGDDLTFKKLLEEAADEFGISINSLRPSIVGEENGWVKVRVAVVIECDYKRLVKFVKKLEGNGGVLVTQLVRGGDNQFSLNIVAWMRK